MKFFAAAINRYRMIYSVVAFLSIIGLLAWFGMNRQEDPAFPYRYGQILIAWPGADAERVERLVLNVLEEELAQIEEINEIRGTARLGMAYVTVGMHQYVYDTDSVWDQVRVAVGQAASKFPDGVGPIRIRDRTMDIHGIVLAITGSDDLLELLDAARQLRRDLFRIPDIGPVYLIADPGEQIDISFDPARTRELGLTYDNLAMQLMANNQVVPGGTLRIGDRNLVLRVLTDFVEMEELAAMPIRTGNGALLPLAEIASIRLGPADPATERVWFNGKPAVALGIVIPENRLNAVRFGEQVRALVSELNPSYAPLQIEEMFYQPQWVEKRLTELGRSLLLGVVIVAAVLLLFMGFRMGLLVAGLLPMVTLSGLAVYAMGGGVLHQVAVAGMVIALGMLVDNAIVMVENMQWHLDRGKGAIQSAEAAVRELAGPLAAATGTTLAAFTPLLLASGDTADFTRTVPVVVMLILLVSYLYAIMVTPVMASRLLRPIHAQSASRFESIGTFLGNLAMRAPGRILVGAFVLIIAALACNRYLEHDFFPNTDRNQLAIDLNFAEGTRVETTAFKTGVVVERLAELPRVRKIHHFAGFTGPRFYYNLIERPRTPHLARIILITESDADIPEIITWIRLNLPNMLPEAQVITRRLGQGRPLLAPVEIRLFSENATALYTAGEQMMALLRTIDGAEDVRHQMGEGIPTMVFSIDDAEAARYGISRQAIALTLVRSTLGQTITTWQAGRLPLPVKIRTPEGERLPSHSLEGLQVQTAIGPMPLSLFVRTSLEFQPAVIEHRDLRRMTSVLAETAEGITYSHVMKQLIPVLANTTLPEGVHLQIAGSSAEAKTANAALFQTLPLGILLLLIFLLFQFNSFRLVGIVLVTIPLAAVGVIPGLILAGQPFSMTSMVGVIALVGIVVNNAIVLLDVIGNNRRIGIPFDQAVIEAVSRRTRPILLTTFTTVAGLFPLTFTQSTLWPPLAWAIITGLLASSTLTLIVIPALYKVSAPARVN